MQLLLRVRCYSKGLAYVCSHNHIKPHYKAFIPTRFQMRKLRHKEVNKLPKVNKLQNSRA